VEYVAMLELQDQLRRFTKQIAQVKKVMRELSYFEGSLDPNHCLKWVQPLRKARGCLDE